MFKRVYANV